jgi:hypothetical protein
LDSNFGNLCLPEKSSETNLYYCYFLFSNNFNDFSKEFVISQTNPNDFYTIYITKVFKDNTILEYSNKLEYINFDSTEDIDYYLFKFEFQNGEIKNILSALYLEI